MPTKPANQKAKTIQVTTKKGADQNASLSADLETRSEETLAPDQVTVLEPKEVAKSESKFYPFSNDAIFEVVMRDEKIARGIVDSVLGKKISYIQRKNAQQHERPDAKSKSIVMDYYLEDKDALYDIEMQTYKTGTLGKRCRYYQSVMDTSSLKEGQNYEDLKDSYIIFLSTCDQLKQKEPMLVFNRVCTYNIKGASSKSIKLNSNDTIVICNAKAYKKASGKLRDLLEYIATGKVAKGNDFIKRLHKAVKAANGQKEVRSTAMFFETPEFKMKDYARSYAADRLEERDAERDAIEAKRDAARLAQLQTVLQQLVDNGEISQKAKEAVLNSQTDEKVLQEA